MVQFRKSRRTRKRGGSTAAAARGGGEIKNKGMIMRKAIELISIDSRLPRTLNSDEKLNLRMFITTVMNNPDSANDNIQLSESDNIIVTKNEVVDAVAQATLHEDKVSHTDQQKLALAVNMAAEQKRADAAATSAATSAAKAAAAKAAAAKAADSEELRLAESEGGRRRKTKRSGRRKRKSRKKSRKKSRRKRRRTRR